MKILVTGGLGFVGSNLVDKLVDQGHEVHVVDNLSSTSSSKTYMNKKADYTFIDVIDLIDPDMHMYCKYDVIYHLAAEARIQPSFEKPFDWFRSNMLGTAAVMEFARITSSGIVVYATTSSKNHGSPYISPYTYSKVAGEDILKTYAYCYDMKCASATFYNVYGDREPEQGEYATVIAKFLRQYKNNEPITVVGDGSQTRDFTHVDDICDGLIAISKGDWKGENFDLGKGEPMSILDLAKMICDDTNVIKHVPLRKNEGLHTQSEWLRTFTLTKWKAQKNLKDYITQNK